MSELLKRAFELFGVPEIDMRSPATSATSATPRSPSSERSDPIHISGEEFGPQNAFLDKYIPPPVATVLPDWRGLLIKSTVLDMSVWVVRNRQDGEELAKETGHAALMLDDIISQRGRTTEEARAALLPLLITGMAN